MHYFLRQILPPDSDAEPIRIYLTEDEVQVGRRSKISLTKFPQISRDHATFYKSDNGSLFVKDLKSLNGVYVNDERIGSSLRPIAIGDVIGFGVNSDQIDVGFVCMVCFEDPNVTVKHEVIELSDDDDEEEPQNLQPVAVNGIQGALRSGVPVVKDVASASHSNASASIHAPVVNDGASASYSNTLASRCAPVVNDGASRSCFSESSNGPVPVVNDGTSTSCSSSLSNGRALSHLEDKSSFPSKCNSRARIKNPQVSQNVYPSTSADTSTSRAFTGKKSSAESLNGYDSSESDECSILDIDRNVIATTNSDVYNSRKRKILQDNGSSSFPKEHTSTSANTSTSYALPHKRYSAKSVDIPDGSELSGECSILDIDRNVNTNSDVCNSRKRKILQDNSSSSFPKEDPSTPVSTSNSFALTEKKYSAKSLDVPGVSELPGECSNLHTNKNVSDTTNSDTCNSRKRKILRDNGPPLIPKVYPSTSASTSTSYALTDKKYFAKSLNDPDISDFTNKCSNLLVNKSVTDAAKSDIHSNIKREILPENGPSSSKAISCESYSEHKVTNKPQSVKPISNSAKSSTKSAQYYFQVNETVSKSDSNVLPYGKSFKSSKTAESCNNFDASPVQLSAIVKTEKKSDVILAECVVPLMRCDSEHFKWPADVKKPLNDHKNKSSGSKIRQMSDSSNEYLRQSLNIKRENNIADHPMNTPIAKSLKRSSVSFDDETSKPSTSKKPCTISNNNNNVNKFQSNISDHSKKSQPLNNPEPESNSDNEMNYSQYEDVIYISDDDEYLDFNSSQNYVHIKTEPVEFDDQNEENDCAENLDIDDELECAASGAGVNNIACVGEEIEENVETIESIKAFVNDVNVEKKLKSNSSFDAHSLSGPENDYFPVLSQNFDSDEENNLNRNIESKTYSDKYPITSKMQKSACKNNFAVKAKADEVESTSRLSKKEKQSSKIQLIDAQPMQYRPRKMRGRDEGFIEKPKTHSSSSTKKQKGHIQKQQSPKGKKESSSNSRLQNFKIPLKRNKGVNPSSEKRRDNPPLNNSAVPRQNSTSLKKTPTVKTRPEKFGSRSGFLVNEIEINPRRTNKTVSEKDHKVPKKNDLSKSGKQYNSSSCVSNKSVAPKMPVPVSPPLLPPVPKKDVFNPKDPRQNRNPSSSYGLSSSSSIFSQLSPRNHMHSQLTNDPSSSKSFDWPHHSTYSGGNEQNNLISHQLKSRLIKELLYLNTKWLQEQSKKKAPPDPVMDGASTLPLKYDKYESYVSSFYPMIRLELWEQMYTESKEIFESKKLYQKFYFSILSCSSVKDYIELKCESVVNKKVSFTPGEGNIVIFELKESSNKCSPVFGYICKHKVEPLNFNSLKLLHWKKLPDEWITNAKHWTFHAQIKKKEMTFALDSLMKGNGLCYIRNKLRLVDALSNLQNSPLLDDFIQPRWQTFLVKYSAICPTREFNSGQMELIEGVTSELKKSQKEPKIILVQGPPGTGKTHAIIGLIQRYLALVKCNPNFKILVAAPSNAAVDEIGCRLLKLNENFQSKGAVKFVRVGMPDQIHVSMKPYSLDRLANDNFQSPGSLQKEKELQGLLSEIGRLKESASKEGAERLKYLEERCKYLTESNNVSHMDYHTEMKLKQKILKDSHIVLSTLSSCGLSLLLKTFKPNSGIHFSFCIVDECTQCTELEILQPLMLGVSKLVLVGDHKQLPATVLSKTACNHGFERSAFERFHTYFETFCKKTPMFTLSEQFRMHSAICEFPSKFIYNHKLITNPNVNMKYASFPLKPYMLLDAYVSQEKDDLSSKINCTEAQIIINICTCLLDIVDSVSSIGIITPYQGQRALYISALGVNPRYKDIEVNTVDGFQGREKDIVIVSCVRANQSGSIGFLACRRRLNVALTRARQCLIICGNVDSLMNNPGWRELITDAKERHVHFPVKGPKDIPFVFKKYMRKNRTGHGSYL